MKPPTVELASCETPGCDRQVKLPAGYCCSTCSQAHDRHTTVPDGHHAPGCDVRQAVYVDIALKQTQERDSTP